MLRLLFWDIELYICAFVFAVLLWYRQKKNDRDLILFILADVFYFIGDILFDTVGARTGIPIDVCFFVPVYYFIFLFFRRRTRTLVKNPAHRKRTELITGLLVATDFLILAALAFVVFYYLDRVTVSPRLPPAVITPGTVSNFLYPALDMAVLGYYICISKIYIMSNEKIYLPLSAGALVWTIGDFLFAYEGLFGAGIYGIGEYLQAFGLLTLIVMLVMILRNGAGLDYSTLDLSLSGTKFESFTILINLMALSYCAVYACCAVRCAGAPALMDAAEKTGIAVLALTLIRQNIILIDSDRRIRDLSADARTDPLTGLYTRKYAFTLMESVYKSALYFNMRVSALMLDIDHFKKFNDTYGHPAGDCVLMKIAGIIRSSVESTSIICRYGGEEILILMPGADRISGLLTAEKIRRNIESCDFGSGNMTSPERVTISIGGATSDEGAKNEFDLIKRADDSLYKAKEQRNKCAWYTPGQLDGAAAAALG